MADLKINSRDWNALSQDNQDKIVDILRRSGLIMEHDQVVGDPDAAPVSEIIKAFNAEEGEDGRDPYQ